MQGHFRAGRLVSIFASVESARVGLTRTMDLRPLPEGVPEIFAALAAPPRLRSHLALVHDVACQIVGALDSRWPDLRYDRAAVLFGAATHDIGKAVHRRGAFRSRHAPRGGRNEAAHRARHFPTPRSFRSHARGGRAPEPSLDLEDLLVRLADKVWKGVRDDAVENQVAGAIASQQTIEVWQAFMFLDDLLSTVAAGGGPPSGLAGAGLGGVIGRARGGGSVGPGGGERQRPRSLAAHDAEEHDVGFQVAHAAELRDRDALAFAVLREPLRKERLRGCKERRIASSRYRASIWSPGCNEPPVTLRDGSHGAA